MATLSHDHFPRNLHRFVGYVSLAIGGGYAISPKAHLSFSGIDSFRYSNVPTLVLGPGGGKIGTAPGAGASGTL